MTLNPFETRQPTTRSNSENDEYGLEEDYNDSFYEEETPFVVNDHHRLRRIRSKENDFRSISNNFKSHVISFTIILGLAAVTAAILWRVRVARTPEIAVTDSVTNESTDLTFPTLTLSDPDRPIPLLDENTLDVSSMRKRFQAAKDAFIDQLSLDYGKENFQAMFVQDHVPIGRLAFRSGGDDEIQESKGKDKGISLARLKRKILMKLLQAQLIQKGHVPPSRNPSQSSLSHSSMISFIWATGGHSAAAGHGNLFNESYTATLERALQPALRETGLFFQARNYAMGGTYSGPELALCNTAVFGVDYDVLSWDFNMLDLDNYGKPELYFRQAAMHPNRPATVGAVIHGYGEKGLKRIFKNLEQSGIAGLYIPPKLLSRVYDNIPDSSDKNESQLAAMPKYVKNFKCDGGLEEGDPGCSSCKFTNVQPTCDHVKYRVSWHRGWKWHALLGNVIALSMLEIVDSALVDLQEMDLSDPTARYQELKRAEDADYKIFFTSLPISFHEELISADQRGNNNDPNSFDMSLLYQHRSYCHTALLPAEARYLGILTDTSADVGFFHYDRGMSMDQASQSVNNSTKIRLAFDANQRQPCSFLLEVDYKDFFYLSEQEGMKHLLLPNDAELRTYYHPITTSSPPLQLKGFIAYSLHVCEGNRGACLSNELREPDLDAGAWEMTINGILVTSSMNINTNVNFVRHLNGWQFTPNQDGRFDIQIRVKEIGKFLRFSSFIIL